MEPGFGAREILLLGDIMTNPELVDYYYDRGNPRGRWADSVLDAVIDEQQKRAELLERYKEMMEAYGYGGNSLELNRCWHCEELSGIRTTEFSHNWRLCRFCDVAWSVTAYHGPDSSITLYNANVFGVFPENYMDLSKKDALACP